MLLTNEKWTLEQLVHVVLVQLQASSTKASTCLSTMESSPLRSRTQQRNHFDKVQDKGSKTNTGNAHERRLI